MNLLCPNCGKMLTVQEQYAGQMMKCPLCAGTFTVPALPAGGAEPPATVPPPVPPTPAPDPYPLRSEPAHEPEPAFTPVGPPEPAFSLAPSEPAFATTPSVSTDIAPPPHVTPGPALPPLQVSAQAAPTLDSRSRFTLWLRPQVLRWVVPAGLLLIFFLQFFSWVGLYPGGIPALTQGAWGAAFGLKTEDDKDMKTILALPTSEQIAERNKNAKEPEKDPNPGVSVLLLFYILLFVPTLLIALAVAALPFLKAPLPPQVQQLLPWQWAALAGLNAILLLFLVLQLLLGFSLENSYTAYVRSKPAYNKATTTSHDEKKLEVEKGKELSFLNRTIWLKLAVLLHIVVTVCAGLVFWEEKRGTGAPVPCIDFRW